MALGLDKIKKLTGTRTKLIDKIIATMEKKAGIGQRWLMRSLIEDLLDKLELDGDRIKNTSGNRRYLAMVDQLFSTFENKAAGAEISKAVLDGVDKIMNFNVRYFKALEPTKMGKILPGVIKDISSWLGVDPNGKLQRNGYLSTLIHNSGVRNRVKDIVLTSVIGQAGYQDTKDKIRDFIGTEEKAGALLKYYRNFVYDTFSQVDRTNSLIFADRLDLRFAIYEGGLIKTSRKFCRDHNGNVYARQEIADFDIVEARPPGYDPFTDLGGYGCRHHLNWIPDSVAYALRPELRTLYPKEKAA